MYFQSLFYTLFKSYEKDLKNLCTKKYIDNVLIVNTHSHNNNWVTISGSSNSSSSSKTYFYSNFTYLCSRHCHVYLKIVLFCLTSDGKFILFLSYYFSISLTIAPSSLVMTHLSKSFEKPHQLSSQFV